MENRFNIKLTSISLNDVQFDWSTYEVDSGRQVGYQRTDGERRARKIVDHFDQNLLEPPTMIQHADGSIWCIDGQARVLALRSLGYTHVDARFLSGLTKEQEVDVFINLQEGRKSLSPGERALALSSVKGSWAQLGFDLLEKYGLSGRGKKNTRPGLKNITVSGVLATLNNEASKPGSQHGFIELLDYSLSVLRDAYPGEHPFSSASIFGMWTAVQTVDVLPDKQSLVSVLKDGKFMHGEELSTFGALSDFVTSCAEGSSGKKPQEFQRVFRFAVGKA